MTNLLVKRLDDSCWNAKINDTIYNFNFQLEPTLFLNGGTFKLHWFDQIIRDLDVLYAFRDEKLVMEAYFLGVKWRCIYDGGALIWTTNGRSMTWEKSQHCNL